MAWISFLLLIPSLVFGAALEKFLTKHSVESIRYISSDGRVAYIMKRPGVLALVTNFRSVEFVSEAETSDFKVHASRAHTRVVIEVVENFHREFNLYRLNKILVGDWGGTTVKEVGRGINPRLHRNDEWLSWFDPIGSEVVLYNVLTQKKFQQKINKGANPFFVPQVELVGDTLLYTNMTAELRSELMAISLLTKNVSLIHRSTLKGSFVEVCQGPGYLAVGEFPHEGVSRSSQIMYVKLTPETDLESLETIYNSQSRDIGNLLCIPDAVYFVKTVRENERLKEKFSEAARLDLKSKSVAIRSSLLHVNQLIQVDDRVLIPYRGDFFVLEGQWNLGDDSLKPGPGKKEELPLEI